MTPRDYLKAVLFAAVAVPAFWVIYVALWLLAPAPVLLP